MSALLARNLATVTAGEEVWAHVLLSTGQTISASGWEINSEGLLMGETPDSLLVLVDPAHVVATYIPENDQTPIPWKV